MPERRGSALALFLKKEQGQGAEGEGGGGTHPWRHEVAPQADLESRKEPKEVSQGDEDQDGGGGDSEGFHGDPRFKMRPWGGQASVG